MENLVINRIVDEPYSPVVRLSVEMGMGVIEGESFMEEPNAFYMPVLEWMKQYVAEDKGDFELNIKLIYYNTSSSKMLLYMLEILYEYKTKGAGVTVNWYYDPEDYDMLDDIHDYSVETDMEINKIPMNE